MNVFIRFCLILSICTSLIFTPLASEYAQAGQHESKKKSTKIQTPFAENPRHPISEVAVFPNTFSSSLEKGRYKTDIQFAINAGLLHLSALTADHLRYFTDESLYELLTFLSKKKVQVLLMDELGKNLSKHWHHALRLKKKETNAAAALAFKIASQRDEDTLSRMIILAPEAILPSLKDYVGDVLSADVTAKALVGLIKEENVGLLICESGHRMSCEQYVRSVDNRVNWAAFLFRIYLRHWSKKNPEKIILGLDSMFKKMKANLTTNSQDQIKKPQMNATETGRLIGVILAGTFKHVAKIKASDDRRTMIINSASNLIWALSSFLGMIPVASMFTSVICGTVATLVVAGAVVWDFTMPSRDFTDLVTHFEGQLETTLEFKTDELIKEHPEKAIEARDIIEKEFRVIRSTLHLNGLKD